MALLSACAPIRPGLPAPLTLPASARDTGAADAAAAAASRRDELRVVDLPSVPARTVTQFAKSREAAATSRAEGAPSDGDDVGTINLQQVPLPTFVQLVYAEMLKRNVNVDPAVQARKELVTFRTGAAQKAGQLDNAVKLLLKSYGVAVIDVGGLVRVVPDNAQLGNLPELRRGDASPDTPLPLRPIYQLVGLQAVRQNEVAGWLKTLFGTRLNVQEDLSRNALLLSGTPDTMQAALEAIRVLDQPVMTGRRSVAISPAFWSADDLARRLIEVLGAQGYSVAPLGQPPGVRYPVILLPVVGTNQIYVFATSDDVVQHVLNWARTLDKPNERGIGKNYFTYQVKHKDAGTLAKTLEQLLSGSRSRVSPATTGAAGAASAPLTSVVVDQSTTMLIFQAGADEYSQFTALLQTLDRPAKGALIEVTVAELSVIENSQLGVEWLFNQDLGGGRTGTFGTQGGIGLGSGGFNFRVLNTAGSVRLALNALASNNQATILSSPRVLTRNGEQALIQVGQEVPIITSQQTTTGTISTGTQAAILQTVQYRNTGVILRVKPVIHSGDQVDLEVSQEVSAASATNTGVNNSPTFSSRKLETKLTLRNGATVMMGGLISNDAGDTDAGIPGLKDIPFFGHLFSNKTKSGTRRELVVLITPYILNDSHEAEAMTDAFRKMLGPWAETAGVQPTSALVPAPAASAGPAPTR